MFISQIVSLSRGALKLLSILKGVMSPLLTSAKDPFNRGDVAALLGPPSKVPLMSLAYQASDWVSLDMSVM